MRAIALGLCATCVLIASPQLAAEPKKLSKTADEAARMQAVGDRWADRWQGRQHYLYDEDSPPETTASGARDAQACAAETMRVRRADGSAGSARIDRCR